MKKITFYYGKRTRGVLIGYGKVGKVLKLEIVDEAAEMVGKLLTERAYGRISTAPTWISLDLAGGGKRYVNLNNVLWFDIERGGDDNVTV